MKKRWKFAALVAILALAVIGCPTDGGGGGGDDTMWTVAFELGEHGTGTAPSAKEVKDGYEIETSWLPSAPDTDDPDFMFSRWEVKGENVPARGYVVKKDIVLVAMWATPIDITFKMFKDDTAAPIVIKIPQGGTFEDAQKTLPTPKRDGEWQFAYWAFANANGDPDPTAKVLANTPFAEAATVIGHWYSTKFAYDPATDNTNSTTEKVRLNNGAFVIYAFPLSGDVTGTGPNGDITIDDLTAIKGIKLKQQINEAAYNMVNVRAWRVYGPYAYNKDDIVINQSSWSTGDVLHGDFKITAEQTYIAKLNGNDSSYSAASMLRFNKFHPFMIYDGTQETGFNQTNGWDSGASAENTGAIKVNEWFPVNYEFDSAIPTTDDNGGKSLGRTLQRLKTAAADTLPFGTNYNMVYFAFGPSTADATNSITYLIKDVVLVLDNDTEIPGQIPEWDGDNDTWDQTFASYEDGSRLVNWRGDPAAPIVTLEEGDFEDIDTSSIPLDNLADSGPGHFYLRLGSFNSAVYHSSADHPKPSGTFTGKFTAGPLGPLTYDAQNMRTAIALTPVQTALLAKAQAEDPDNGGKVKVTIVGSTTSSTTTENWRFFLGDATESTWNLSSGSGRVKLPRLFEGNATDDEGEYLGYWDDTIGLDKAASIKHFILQMADANGGGYGGNEENITITSIRIDYTIKPPPPCNCTTDPDFQCDGVFMLGCTGLCACKDDPEIGGVPLDLANNAIPGLTVAGGPATLKKLPGGAIFVGGRGNDWDAVDIKITTGTPDANTIGLTAATTYRIKVTGKAVANSSTSGLNAEIMRTGRPYSSATHGGNIYVQKAIVGTEATNTVVSFTAETDGSKTGAEFIYSEDSGGTDTTASNPNNIRFRVHTGAAPHPSFVIDTIEIWSTTQVDNTPEDTTDDDFSYTNTTKIWSMPSN